MSMQLKLIVFNSSLILMLLLSAKFINVNISLPSLNILVTSSYSFTFPLFLRELMLMLAAGRRLHRHFPYTAHTCASIFVDFSILIVCRLCFVRNLEKAVPPACGSVYFFRDKSRHFQQLNFDSKPFHGICLIPYQTDSKNFLTYVSNRNKLWKSIPKPLAYIVYCIQYQYEYVYEIKCSYNFSYRKTTTSIMVSVAGVAWKPIWVVGRNQERRRLLMDRCFVIVVFFPDITRAWITMHCWAIYGWW